ncbi:MAG TPA: hypothetical protein VJB97_03080 [Candidatus Paceibacterota bacterium]
MMERLLSYVWTPVFALIVLALALAENGVPRTLGEWAGFALLALFLASAAGMVAYLTATGPTIHEEDA